MKYSTIMFGLVFCCVGNIYGATEKFSFKARLTAYEESSLSAAVNVFRRDGTLLFSFEDSLVPSYCTKWGAAEWGNVLQKIVPMLTSLKSFKIGQAYALPEWIEMVHDGITSGLHEPIEITLDDFEVDSYFGPMDLLTRQLRALSDALKEKLGLEQQSLDAVGCAEAFYSLVQRYGADLATHALVSSAIAVSGGVVCLQGLLGEESDLLLP